MSWDPFLRAPYPRTEESPHATDQQLCRTVETGLRWAMLHSTQRPDDHLHPALHALSALRDRLAEQEEAQVDARRYRALLAFVRSGQLERDHGYTVLYRIRLQVRWTLENPELQKTEDAMWLVSELFDREADRTVVTHPPKG